VIYVAGEKFYQCKYLLIEIPKEEIEYFEDITSIDEISEKLDHSLEKKVNLKNLKPEIEFWGHSSNLQTWAENHYDTSLLHSNLAFPLLKKLTHIGDPLAKRVFKNEIAERLTSGHRNVEQYLIQENYLEYFNKEETDVLMEYFFEQIERRFMKQHSNELDKAEIDILLDFVEFNISNSKVFLLNELRSLETIDKGIQLGYTYEQGAVKTLGFNKCGVKTLPLSIGNFKCVRELFLTENRIHNVPESIRNLKSLEKLDLSDNLITTLPNMIDGLINLKELHINHNSIQNLPNSISKLNNLEVLSIWGNQLKEIPININDLVSLRVFGLSFNRLQKLPDIPLKFEHLEILDLSNNNLKNIAKSFEYLPSLKALWLNNNPIQTLPESLLGFNSLNDLYIVNTPIAVKPDNFSKKIIFHLEKNDVNVWK
jgi:Leucine-rich repeat (LRR) protein